LWLNSGNSGTLLTVLRSPNPTKKNARAQWSEFSAVESDDDDDDDNDFLYHQLTVYHRNPADDSDDSLSDIFYHDKHDNLSSDLLFQEDEQTDSVSERQQGNSKSEREGGSDEGTDSASERDVGFDEETDSASESVDGSGIGASGSVDTNPGPVIPPNDETAFSSTLQFPKDQANLVKLELVNLVLEIGAPLHLFHKIAQWAARANSCGHIFKLDDCPHYKTYLKDLTKRLKLESLSHTMEDVLVPWGGRVKFPVFEFWAMFQSLIDDPRLRKELLINWNNPSSIPPYDKDYLDEIHSAEWYHDSYKLYNIQDGTFVVLCGLIFFLDRTHVAGNDRQGIECLFFTLSIIPRQFRNRSWSWHPLGIMPKFEANDSKGQNATAFHHVLSVLLRGVQEAHSLGGLITDVLGPDGLQ
jgi:hypothetical protein